jgi:heparan sulfate 6-O-sulfotransferase HS6ST1
LKNIYLITLIRNPLSRYVSEWNHFVRKSSNNRQNYTLFEANSCNKGKSIKNCSQDTDIEMFQSCFPDSVNRISNILADYDLNDTNCTLFQVENERKLLDSAKNVLKGMTFFGLTEYEEKSQKLFEKTFKTSFKIDFKPSKLEKKSSAEIIIKKMNESLKEKLIKLNGLDFELYEYAKELFFSRLKFFKIKT